MPDFDVAATGLASPPASAPVTSYTPAVSVKNLGLYSADVTGLLRIYDKATGVLLATHNLAASAISPGQTKNATSSAAWEPTVGDIGKSFLFSADIYYPPDQYDPNNHLPPVTVTVNAEEPPPPEPEVHAYTHEVGGSDEINVEELAGRLRDQQTPEDHHTSHESDGTDQLSVAGLIGLLATPQTPTLHGDEHGAGKDDEIDVAGLSGLLADAQTPALHTNDKHSPFMLSCPGTQNPNAPFPLAGSHGHSYPISLPAGLGALTDRLFLIYVNLDIDCTEDNSAGAEGQAWLKVQDQAGWHSGATSRAKHRSQFFWATTVPVTFAIQATGELIAIELDLWNNGAADITFTIRDITFTILG